MKEHKEILNAGIIGLSEGNGHPFSWAAICNGYDEVEMKKCPFPSIPEYLSKQIWPADRFNEMRITHIWTQDQGTSNLIAKASKIPFIVNDYLELVDQVDLVLLARDDAENHLKMSSGFLKAGLPVLIDKPFALEESDALSMLELQRFEYQIFTCSSLRYAEEIMLTDQERRLIGNVLRIKAQSPKYWETYGVHLIEPIIVQFSDRGNIDSVYARKENEELCVTVNWDSITAELSFTGKKISPISFTYIGEKAHITKEFTNSFKCFRKTLEEFVNQTKKRKVLIDRNETLEIVKIIECGQKTINYGH